MLGRLSRRSGDPRSKDVRSSDPDTMLRQISAEIGPLGLEVANAAGVIAGGQALSDEIARSFHGVTASVERTRASTEAIAFNAARSSDLIASTAAVSGEAVGSVAEATAEMEALCGTITGMAARLDTLRTALSTVQEASAAIAGIANKTNLLAMNAAIEAARAGEAGRGFAVVANEVKRLAETTKSATDDISRTIDDLAGQVSTLAETGEGAADRARKAAETSTRVGRSVNDLGAMVEELSDAGAQTRIAAETITDECASLSDSVQDLDTVVDQVGSMMSGAMERMAVTTSALDRMVGDTAMAVETPDTAIIRAAQAAAAEISTLFEAEVDAGRIALDALFDRNYRPLAGTDPEQVMARFTEMTDRVLPAVQEPLLAAHDRVVFCAAVDTSGYLPTHNKAFSHAQSSDPVWNNANCRDRRIFDDPVGLSAGRNTEPFRLMTYRRDMGGGAYAMMKDVAAPIIVGGRHWGGFRIGYRPT